MLDRIHLVLPIFHSFGHKASCQVYRGVWLYEHHEYIIHAIDKIWSLEAQRNRPV